MNRHVNAIAGRLSLRPPQRSLLKYWIASRRSCPLARMQISRPRLAAIQPSSIRDQL